MKKHVRVIMLVCFVALIVAACGGQTTTAPQAPAPQAPAQAPAQKPAQPQPQAPAQAPAAQPTTAQAPAAAPKAPEAAKATAPAAAPAAQKGGQYIDASFAEAVSFQPLLTQDTASSAYQARIYAGLTRLDPQTLEVVGDLYEGKPELSADGKTLTWKLRKDLKWSDGKPLTSADVVFTWQKMMDEKVKFPYRKLYSDAFSDVTAKDDLTVVYTMKQPGFCPAIVQSGLTGPIPKHVFENVDINQNDHNLKPTVTSGPWKLKEWQKDANAIFSPAYKDYVRGEANLETVITRIVKDSTVQTQMFKTQEVDVAQPQVVDWEEIKKLPHANALSYYAASGAGWVYIGFNLRHPVLGEKKVRQAIASGINVKEMVDTIRQGYATQQFSAFPSSSWVYTDNVPKFPYNVEKAKTLLKDAGLTTGAGGALMKDGQPIKLRLHYNAGNKDREQISVLTQQYLKALGIEVEVQAEEWNAYLERVTKNFDFDMFVLGWSSPYEPHSSGNIWKTDGGQNTIGYKNAEIDKLYDEGSVVPGCKPEDRKKIYEKIQQIIAEDQPYVFLYTSETLVAYNKKFAVNPLTRLGAAYDMQKWYIQK